MENEHKLVIERYNQCKEERSNYITRWKDVENYLAINSDINSNFENTKQPSAKKDVYINDVTGYVCVNNAGDYLAGILWSPNMVDIEVSDYIANASSGEKFEEFYKRVTERFNKQMNHSDAGFSTVLRSYCYDQESFATSGIGVFRSKEFDNQQSECCLTFKNYNVQNSCIDEGANNKISVIYTVYNWRLNKIIEEFCYEDNQFSKELYSQLPEDIKKAYEANKFNERFKLVNGILPNNSYKMNKRGKTGARYKGYWFLEKDKKVFKEEYYRVLPIAFCRAIRIANQVYGESHGTIAVSTVKMLNYITGITVDNIDKTTDPALGIISGALLSGHTLNRSANAINQFNAEAVKDGNAIFNIAQAGDISALINFLIPLLKQDINNIFKLDQLLDFNNKTEMSATESTYRMSIRGKSIAGVISQQKTEMLEPVIRRAISIMEDCEIFGKSLSDMSENSEEEVLAKLQAQQDNDYIPDVIAQAMKDGKQWYTIKYHGELEKLANNELYSALSNFFQFLQFILQIDSSIAYAIDSYKFLSFCKQISNLTNETFVKSEQAYKEVVEAIQEAQAQQQQVMQNAQNAQTLNQISTANKNNADAQNVNNQDYLSELMGEENGQN